MRHIGFGVFKSLIDSSGHSVVSPVCNERT
jgi:hypothetical protein